MMKKKSFIIVLILISALAKGQIYTNDPSYGKNFNRINTVKVFQLPSDTTLDGATNPCVQIAKIDNIVYTYNCDSVKWVQIGGLAAGWLLDSLYARIDTTRGDNRYILNRNYPKQDADANINALTADTLTISYPTAPNISNRQASGVVGVPGRSLAWLPSSATVSYTWWTDPTFWDMTLRRGAAGVGLWVGDDTTTNAALKVKAQGSAGVNNIITAKDTAGVRFLLNLMLHNGVVRFSINDSIPPYSYSVWFNAGVGINKDSVPITSNPSAVPMGIDTTTGQVVRFIDGGSGSYIQNLYSKTTPQPANATINGTYNIIDGTVDMSNPASGSTKAKVLVARTTDLDSAINDHTFADNSIFQKNSNGIAYNSYDALVSIDGTANYDHYSAFQSRPIYNTTGTTTDHFGFYDVATINAGTLTNRYGYYVANPVGAGALTNNYGIFVNTQTKGTNNYSIYTGTSPTRLGGTLQMANALSSVGSGALINFTSGSSSTVEASINHEIISSTQGNLRLKVRTATGTPPTGMTESLTLLGGASYGVGINTIAPTAKLHVTGTTKFDLGSDATGDIYYRNSSGFFSRLGIGSTGNVLTVSGGLPAWTAPTSSPSLLDVTNIGDTTNKAIEITGNGFSTVKTRGLFLGYDIVNNRAQIYNYNHSSGLYGNIILNASGGGFVGIGKTSPAEALDVNGNIVTNGSINVATTTTLGGRVIYKVSLITSTGTISASDNTLMVSNNSDIVLTLPTAATSDGILYTFKKISNNANTITLTPFGGELIEGAGTKVMTTYKESLTIISYSSNWYIIQ